MADDSRNARLRHPRLFAVVSALLVSVVAVAACSALQTTYVLSSRCVVEIGDGVFTVIFPGIVDRRGPPARGIEFALSRPRERGFRRLGLVLPSRAEGPSSGLTTGVRIPLWLPAAPLALALILISRRRRAAEGVPCTSCAYDLTGNVSGTCPECGRRIPAQLDSKPATREPRRGRAP